MRTILCTHSETRENVRHCYSTRATVSLLRLHARYTLDTGGRVEKYRIKYAVGGESGHHERNGKFENVALRHTRETIDHRYPMRFLGIINMRKQYLSNIATASDDSNISMIITRCRNFYIPIINALIRVCLSSRAWSSRYYILPDTFQQRFHTNYIYFIF